MGYVWYLPYMWLRQRGPELHPQFRVASWASKKCVGVAGSFEVVGVEKFRLMKCKLTLKRCVFFQCVTFCFDVHPRSEYL